MKVALVQLDIAWEDKRANYDQVRQLLDGVDLPANDSLIVLPELFATGFTMDSDSIAEEDLGETESFLVELAREKQAAVVGGVAKKMPPGLKPANIAAIVSPDGQILCRYQKTHPFSLAGEHENYSRGERVETVEVNGFKISPSICYDLRFPEMYRIAACSDAQIYVVIANWPERRNQHWRKLLQARAIENQAYVIGVNRCGNDPNLSYAGSTMLVDYMGEIVIEAENRAQVLEASLDRQALLDWRENFPALRDRHENLSD